MYGSVVVRHCDRSGSDGSSLSHARESCSPHRRGVPLGSVSSQHSRCFCVAQGSWLVELPACVMDDNTTSRYTNDRSASPPVSVRLRVPTRRDALPHDVLLDHRCESAHSHYSKCSLAIANKQMDHRSDGLWTKNARRAAELGAYVDVNVWQPQRSGF